MKVTAIQPMAKGKRVDLPLFLSRISAGFPSPADDFLEMKIDLNEYLIAHPSATFLLRVEGESMKGVGIQSGDLLVVDRSREVKDGNIVVAVLNGEFTVKQVQKQGIKLFLFPANPQYDRIEITEEMEFEVWGVVTSVIHSFSG